MLFYPGSKNIKLQKQFAIYFIVVEKNFKIFIARRYEFKDDNKNIFTIHFWLEY